MPPKLNLPLYVDAIRVGRRTYYYFRYKGQRVRLPDNPASSEFHASYARHKASVEGSPTVARKTAGTVGWMIEAYQASDEFSGLADKTQTSYRREMTRLDPIAHIAAADIKRIHVRELGKALADRPRTRQHFFQVVSLLWNFAEHELDMEGIKNPAVSMKRVGKAKSYLPWSAEQLAAFEASDPPRQLMTAYMVARYTGPRRADISGLMRSHYDGSHLCIAGSKTTDPVEVAVHPRLKAYLDSLPPTLYLITDTQGRPVPADRLTHEMREHLDSIGLPNLHLHGLRHTAGTELAEAGCSAHEIQAVLGHRTLQMTERYTKKASRKRLAGAAILKLRNKDET